MTHVESDKSPANQVYIVATIRPWNIDAYHSVVKHFPGQWHLVDDPAELTPEYVRTLSPRYIFFPHWSHIVPTEILELAECICFHETDLPYGRGGSPIQNLIARGHKDTRITALKMVEALDAGPVYMKRPLSLNGTAAQIFIRASKIVAEMIGEIAKHSPTPAPQVGTPTTFKRRSPKQSEISGAITTTEQLYDHIRMLDAPEYPAAYSDIHGFRFKFKNAILNKNTNELTATVTVQLKEEK